MTKTRQNSTFPLQLLIVALFTTLFLLSGAIHARAVGPSIEVTVDIDPVLKSKAIPAQTVFIFAKAVQGPRAPLAAVRLKVSDLPATVTLDDSKAMAPMFRLSKFNEVLVSARVSQSGRPIKGSGDFEGVTPTIKLGQTKQVVSVTINKVVP